MPIDWKKFPTIAAHPNINGWLTIQSNLGLSENTISAYARALEDYLQFSTSKDININEANKSTVAAYVQELTNRPIKRNYKKTIAMIGLANATLQQKLTAIRLYYDYLVEEGMRDVNPVGRGRYTEGKLFGGKRARGLIQRYRKLPWIPTDELWNRILEITKTESLRNRLMFSLAYDGALRREELCLLEDRDIDPSQRLIHIRGETSKSRRDRVVAYSIPTADLYAQYLHHRSKISRERGPLFLSESRRNKTLPISLWTWTKVIERIAQKADIPQFTTHTLRHLCLTDLARAGWDVHEIASFAGHRSITTTVQYIHLSGRDLALKYNRSMETIHDWRMHLLREVFNDK